VLSAVMLVPAAVAFAQDEAPPAPPIDTADNQPAINTETALFPKWSSEGAIGYTATGKRIKTNAINGDVNVTREGQWTNNFLDGGITYGDVTYPEGDPIASANRYFGTYKLEGYLTRTKKPYLWTLAGAESDQFQGFWGRYTGQGGVGYSYFGTAPQILKTEIGYAFVDTNWIEKKEIDDNEFHYWEPTHNGLARLVAQIPIYGYARFSEEVTYRHNIEDQDDYSVSSSTGLAFRLTSRLSYKTIFQIDYTNQPGLVESLDPYGAVITFDDDGDPATDPVSALEPNEYAAYTFTNALVISFF